MKSSRDCVENFWLSRVDHFLKSNMAQAEYCRIHGLKRSSMNGWLLRFREKYPEKFKDRDFLIDCEVASSIEEEPSKTKKIDQNNLFIEVKSKSVNLSESIVAEIKFNIVFNNLTINFSTYPQANWLCDFIQGLK
jgi:hypothetical protein